eukprot:CAMPEP_0170502652 /NCGR_PEP_ID=MMETSP0208-20121228/42190_1 /TAXON_ID=197538 /ORGANISM="Strombidium inclinatum, Strain S3" /LENGTH=131 /DNA_ID=CAMNT_0010781851 /DNA_START=907 /DNA_END=1302 /DNA_ORIENTATION=+
MALELFSFGQDFRRNLGHLAEANQIIEAAVAFDVDSHTDAEVGRNINSGDRNSSVLAVLALRNLGFALPLLLVKVLKVNDVHAAVHTSRNDAFVLKEGHRSDGSRVLLQEVLLDAQDEVDDDDGSIDQAHG